MKEKNTITWLAGSMGTQRIAKILPPKFLTFDYLTLEFSVTVKSKTQDRS